MSKHVVVVEGRYEGGLRCVARHGPSGHEIATDAPVDNHGRGESFSPTDLVGTAMGTCVCTILGIVAQRRGLDLDGMRFRVEKEMVADPLRRIGRLSLRVDLPATLGDGARLVLEEAARTCPVQRSLHPDVDVVLDFRYFDERPSETAP